MATSERDRKILWGRSASKCALCKRDLVENRTDLDRDSVVGNEAHIVAHPQVGRVLGLLRTQTTTTT